MDKEKLIELLKDAWNDGMSQYHDCKHHSQYKTDLENWLDANEDEINELCVSENTSDERAALHLHVVSQQRELLYGFSTWHNAKPQKERYDMIYVSEIEEFLKT